MARVEQFLLCTVLMSICAAIRAPLDKPNILLFLVDDFGYGDLSSYGHMTQEFGPIDQMGREGMRFTDWYAPAPLCTPSRGSMLTGRAPPRVGLYGGSHDPPVFLPQSYKGLPIEEITIGDALQDLGYATGMVGKWHLGINAFNSTDGSYLPKYQGFDYVGTFMPMSLIWQCDETQTMIAEEDRDTTWCHYYYRDTMLEQPLSFHNTTATLLLEAKAFVYDHQDDPFFFYFSFPHTHTSLFASDTFKGSSRRGFFGDNLNEMSWAIGEMLQLLRELHLERNTLVIFTSDHGPDREMCKQAGVQGSLRGWKANTWEGGYRVPGIAWWPGSIPADVTNHEVISSMDLFALAVDLAGGTVPTDRVIDGRSIKDVLLNGGKSPHKALYYYCGKRLMAVRYKNYKIHYHTQAVRTREQLIEHCGPTGIPENKDDFLCTKCEGTCVTDHDPPLMFDLDQDPEEAYPLDASQYKGILAEAALIVAEHNAGMTYGPALLSVQYWDMSLIPCCNPPFCSCTRWYIEGDACTCKAQE